MQKNLNTWWIISKYLSVPGFLTTCPCLFGQKNMSEINLSTYDGIFLGTLEIYYQISEFILWSINYFQTGLLSKTSLGF